METPPTPAPRKRSCLRRTLLCLVVVVAASVVGGIAFGARHWSRITPVTLHCDKAPLVTSPANLDPRATVFRFYNHRHRKFASMSDEVTRWRYGAEAVLPTTLLYKYECEGEAITFWEAEAIKAGAMVALLRERRFPTRNGTRGGEPRVETVCLVEGDAVCDAAELEAAFRAAAVDVMVMSSDWCSVALNLQEVVNLGFWCARSTANVIDLIASYEALLHAQPKLNRLSTHTFYTYLTVTAGVSWDYLPSDAWIGGCHLHAVDATSIPAGVMGVHFSASSKGTLERLAGLAAD